MRDRSRSRTRACLRGLFNQKQQQTQANAAPVTPEPVVAATPTPAPEEPKDESWTVYVWRGDHVEVVRFKNQDSRERVMTPPPAPVRLPARPGASVPAQQTQAAAGSADDATATERSNGNFIIEPAVNGTEGEG